MDYVSSHLDPRPLVYLYTDFVYQYSDDPSLSKKVALSSFGYSLDGDLSSELLTAFNVYKVDYDLMKRKNFRIFRQSMKTKKKNDYLHWIENNEYYSKRFTFDFYKEYA